MEAATGERPSQSKLARCAAPAPASEADVSHPSPLAPTGPCPVDDLDIPRGSALVYIYDDGEVEAAAAPGQQQHQEPSRQSVKPRLGDVIEVVGVLSTLPELAALSLKDEVGGGGGGGGVQALQGWGGAALPTLPCGLFFVVFSIRPSLSDSQCSRRP